MPVDEPVVIDINDKLVNAINQNLNAICGDQRLDARNFTIFRIPAYIRQINKDLYEPRIVSIGPYYRGNGNLRAMQDHKWRYLQEFLSRNRGNSIEDYVRRIRELEARARRCYFETVELQSDEFVEMLLLDGCFIVEFFMKWKGGLKDAICKVGWSLPLIRSDLLMMENQIPFFALQSLYDLLVRSSPTTSDSSYEGEEAFVELVAEYLMMGEGESPILIPSDPEIHHLLHLYHLCFVPTPRQDKIVLNLLQMLKPSRLISLLHWLRRKRVTRSPRTIPCATELREAGVAFKKKKSEGSFLDITFRDGQLEIPFLSMEESSKSRFMNLVAFEQCSYQVERNMTSFATFMDCIIDTPRDVAILHQCGILENKLASDEEMAIFFNHLCDGAYMDYEKHYLAGLFRDVKHYCDSDWHRWKSRLKRDYFTNPWSFISLVAAIVLLSLAFLQTLFTIYPFYHPRS